MTAYKQTELGLIPSDWEAVELKTLLGFHEKKYKTEKYYTFIGMQDVSSDAKIINQTILPINTLKQGYIYFERDDVLVAKITPCFENGKGCYTHNLKTKIGFGSTEFHVLHINQLATANFIYYWTTNPNFRNKLAINMVGSAGHKRVPIGDILTFKIPLPPKPEQTAIATALSDTDALLAELEKLLAKKHAIKTATMQQLLTGKTRLPEFAHRADGTPKGSLKTEWGDVPEDWEVVALGDVGYFQAGVGFPLTIQGKKSGKYPFFKVSDLNNIGNETYLQASNNYINEQDKELISAKTIPINSIVFAKIGAAVFLERKRINNQESLIDNNMMAYIPNHKFLYKFAYYCFLRMKLSLLVEVTALPSLSSTELGKTKIFIPKSTTEQTAIAQILGDMDSEIIALQARIEKLREIKQGMMQNLLTGKIRLPF